MRRLRLAIAAVVAGFFLIPQQSSAPAESAQKTSTYGGAFDVSLVKPPLNLVAATSSNASRDNNPRPDQVRSYDGQRRWETYLAVRSRFERLWLRPSSKKVIARGNFATFNKFPVLELEDRDQDGKAEFYSYDRPDGRGMTQEFGAFFDLNGDGRPDWIVFYGGLLITKNMKFLKWYSYAIDTNADGRFDVRVYEAIDVDGDGIADEGATAWVYDTNYDGLIDKAEFIVDGHVTPIKPENGVLPLHYVLRTDTAEQPKIGEAMPVQLLAAIANDIAVLSRR